MAAGLRRMVALGPAGTIYPGSAQDYRAYDNARSFSETGTRWVRLWADWPTLMPRRDQPDAVRMAALDDQVARARAAGLKVILTVYRFPGWANGTDALSAEQLAATMPDRRTQSQTDSQAKSLLFRYPDDVSPASAWARWIRLLVTRYSRNSLTRPTPAAYVDALELANEPNHMWWPQQAPSTTSNPYDQGTPILHRVLARMFKTARSATDGYGGEPMLMGPGTSDDTANSRLRTSYRTTTSNVLDELATLGFSPGAKFAWSLHNYADVTYDQGAGSTAPDAATNAARQTNRVADTRKLLVGRWAGWPAGSASAPGVWITEGGVTLASIASRWGITDPVQQRAKQADLIQRSWNRMLGDTEGAGVGMLGIYLFYSDPNFDSGLRDPFELGGAARAAHATWGALPSFA
jgi:hypothetical protein